jgi:hypothetical protein
MNTHSVRFEKILGLALWNFTVSEANFNTAGGTNALTAKTPSLRRLS